MWRIVLAILFALLAALLAVASPFRDDPRSTVQPIAFDHARHHAEDLGCLDCHKTAETGPYASLPRIASCLLCHQEPKGESAEEARVREYAERKEEIPWVQVNRMPGHVYFSHAVHVKLAKMDCAECHGDMSVAKEPVTVSQVEHLTMRSCMECHSEKGASNDCLACHK